MSKSISRRSFLGLCGAIAGTSLISAMPGKAYGWGSFQFAGKSEILDLLGFNDPIHEDAVQFAYSIVLQRHKHDFNKGPKTLLNPAFDSYGKGNSANEYFLENFKFLRIGSYWNDASVNDVFELLDSFLNKDDVSDWKPGPGKTYPNYEDVYDVSEHIGQSHQEKWKENKYRTLTQFCNNCRADFMHSMLSTASDGFKTTGYIPQGKSKRFILSWLEEAYKFSVEKDNSNYEKVKNLLDTYNQLDKNLQNLDTTATFGDTSADDKLSERQLRIKVIGMMCHTIEDSWCPAHTIRAYSKDNFGNILAFGNYMKQNQSFFENFHRYYDYYSELDKNRDGGDLRDILVDEMTPHQGAPERVPVPEQKDMFLENTLNWEGSSHGIEGGVKDASKEFKTLGLKYTIKYLSDFLELCYLEKKWDNDVFYYNSDAEYAGNPISETHQAGFIKYSGVGDWMKNFMFKTELYKPDGETTDTYDSWICDAGRKSLLIDYEILPLIDSLKTPIVNFFPDKGQLLVNKLYDLANKHANFIDIAIKFYSEYNINGSDYCENVSGCNARDAEQACFNAYEDTFLGDDLSLWSLIGDNKDFRDSLSVDENLKWAYLCNTLGRVLQEFQYELNDDHKINPYILDYALKMAGDRKDCDVVGTLESLAVEGDYYSFTLRTKKHTLMYLYCKKTMIANSEDFIEGAKNIKVNVSLPTDESYGTLSLYGVNSVEVPKLEDKRDLEYFIAGWVDEILQDGFRLSIPDFSLQGRSIYDFINTDHEAKLQKNQICFVYYKAQNHKLIATKIVNINYEFEEHRYSSNVTEMYGNCLEFAILKDDIVELRKIKEDLLIADRLFYMCTQISGMPTINSNNCDFIYGIDIPSTTKIKDWTTGINVPKPGYKFAIRIKNITYNCDGSMDFYIPTTNKQHIKTDKKLNSSTIEPCVYKDGYCVYCGAKEDKKDDDGDITNPDDKANSNTNYSSAETSDSVGVIAAAAAGVATLGTAGVYANHKSPQTDETNKK